MRLGIGADRRAPQMSQIGPLVAPAGLSSFALDVALPAFAALAAVEASFADYLVFVFDVLFHSCLLIAHAGTEFLTQRRFRAALRRALQGFTTTSSTTAACHRRDFLCDLRDLRL